MGADVWKLKYGSVLRFSDVLASAEDLKKDIEDTAAEHRPIELHLSGSLLCFALSFVAEDKLEAMRICDGKSDERIVTYTFEPGEMGIDCNDNGRVLKVHKDQQRN